MQKDTSDFKFRSILNFRDAGGIKLADDATMRKGLIFRSANPDKVKKEDIIKLKELGIKTIVDLRGAGEQLGRRVEDPAFQVINFPLALESVTRQKIKPLIKRKFNPDEIKKIIGGLYIDLAESVRPVLGKIARLLLEPERTPLLIHCQAGKDRTGVLSALFQMIAGAGREEIIRDYLASNESLIPYFSRKLKLRKLITFGLFPSEAVLFALTQRHDDIITFLDRIENHYDGVEGYLSGSGFEMSQLGKLKEILIQP